MKIITSKNTSINQIASSFNDGDYVIISGKPGAGIITLGTQILTNFAVKNGYHVQFISFKNDADTIVNDLKEQAKTMYGTEITNTKDSPFIIDTITTFQPSINIIDLFINNRKDFNCKIVFIDCLTMISHPDGIQAISDKLKSFAKENNVIIMTASTTPHDLSKELNPDILIQVD